LLCLPYPAGSLNIRLHSGGGDVDMQSSEFLCLFYKGHKFVTLTAIIPDGPSFTRSFDIGDPEGIQRFIDDNNEDKNIYFSVNPLRTPVDKKADKTQIKGAQWLHVDIDPPDGAGTAEEKRAAVLKKIKDCPVRPTVIIDSGRGYQCFWRLRNFIDFPTTLDSRELDDRIASVEKSNRALSSFFGGDNCHNIDRIMRVPFTRNFPNAKKLSKGYGISQATLVSMDESVHLLTEMEETFEKFARLQSLDAKFKKTLSNNPALKKRWEGDSTGLQDTSRSGMDMSVAFMLKKLGYTLDETVALLMEYPHGQQDERAAGRAWENASVPEQPSWKDQLIYNGRKIAAVEANVVIILEAADEFVNHIFWDEIQSVVFTDIPMPWSGTEKIRSWTDHDDISLTIWIQRQEVFVNKGTVSDSVVTVAKKHRRNKLREHIEGITWDGTPRIDELFTRYFNCTNMDQRYVREVSRRWSIGCIARLMVPGTKVDTMLILEGNQGIGKSTALKTLCGVEWFMDDLYDFSSKDQIMKLSRKWIVEISELASMKKAEADDLKRFLSIERDEIRLPYGRKSETVERRCIFAGTVNPDGTNYLKDTTGNRRYWPIECGSKAIDIDGLMADRDQIWAEALLLFLNHEGHWISPDLVDLVVQQQGDKEITDEVEILVEKAIWARKVGEESGAEMWEDLDTPRTSFSSRMLTIELFQTNVAQRRSNEGDRIVRALLRLGFVKDKNKTSPGDGMPRERLWQLPKDKIPPRPPVSNAVNQARMDREKRDKIKEAPKGDVGQTDALMTGV